MKILAAAISICLAVGLTTIAQAQVTVSTSEGNELIYRNSYALIIHSHHYKSRAWKDLQTEEQFKSLKSTLGQQRFVIEDLENATSDVLTKAIRNFILRHRGGKNRLLVYYMGHGYTDKTQHISYLVPTDAEPAVNSDGSPNSNPNFIEKLVPTYSLREWVKEAQDSSIMMVFDSCFSGAILAYRANVEIVPDVSVEELERPARKAITAGTENQKVNDPSPFTPLFISGIKGDADRNRDGLVTDSELKEFLVDRVPQVAKLMPQGGDLSDTTTGAYAFQYPRKLISTPASEKSWPTRTVTGVTVKIKPTPTHQADVMASVNSVSAKFKGIDVRYYRKTIDGDKIVNALDKYAIPYTVRPAMIPDEFGMNAVACGSNVPIEALRTLLLVLYDSGIKARLIATFHDPASKKNSLEVLSFRLPIDESDGWKVLDWPPLTREEIQKLDRCKNTAHGDMSIFNY